MLIRPLSIIELKQICEITCTANLFIVLYHFTFYFPSASSLNSLFSLNLPLSLILKPLTRASPHPFLSAAVG